MLYNCAMTKSSEIYVSNIYSAIGNIKLDLAQHIGCE